MVEALLSGGGRTAGTNEFAYLHFSKEGQKHSIKNRCDNRVKIDES